jgi:hypothetical protein
MCFYLQRPFGLCLLLLQSVQYVMNSAESNRLASVRAQIVPLRLHQHLPLRRWAQNSSCNVLIDNLRLW